MDQQNKPNRGGARPGAGRKPMDLMEKQVDELIIAFRKTGKENMATAGSELARIAFKGENDRVRLKALYIYYRAVAVRKSHSRIEKHISGPVIGLPPIMTRPEKQEDETVGRLH
jgi:hypothetical protein